MEHCAWWKPASNGYTYSRKEAGRYTYEEALKILSDANFATGNNPHEAMILERKEDEA